MHPSLPRADAQNLQIIVLRFQMKLQLLRSLLLLRITMRQSSVGQLFVLLPNHNTAHRILRYVRVSDQGKKTTSCRKVHISSDLSRYIPWIRASLSGLMPIPRISKALLPSFSSPAAPIPRSSHFDLLDVVLTQAFHWTSPVVLHASKTFLSRVKVCGRCSLFVPHLHETS